MKRPHIVFAYPNCRSFASIQHVELNASLVDYAPSNTVQGINLAEYGSLANASEAGVAGASAKIFHLWGDERRLSPSPRCRCAGFSAGMAAAYDNHIVVPARRPSLATTESAQRLQLTWRRRKQLLNAFVGL